MRRAKGEMRGGGRETKKEWVIGVTGSLTGAICLALGLASGVLRYGGSLHFAWLLLMVSDDEQWPGDGQVVRGHQGKVQSLQ